MARKRIEIISGVITANAERKGTSRAGNPTYEVTVDRVARLTEVDGIIGYFAANFRTGDSVTISVGAGNRIFDIVGEGW